MRGLITMPGTLVTKAWEPRDAIMGSAEDPQPITIITYPAVPLFLMSPRTRVYYAKDIHVQQFKGYLSKFEPDGFDEEGEPEATVTLEVVT